MIQIMEAHKVLVERAPLDLPIGFLGVSVSLGGHSRDGKHAAHARGSAGQCATEVRVDIRLGHFDLNRQWPPASVTRRRAPSSLLLERGAQTTLSHIPGPTGGCNPRAELRSLGTPKAGAVGSQECKQGSFQPKPPK